MSTITNLSIFRGEDVTCTITMSPTTNITGWTLTGEIRQNTMQAGSALVSVTGTITDAANGVFTIVFADTDTDSLPLGDYIWAAKRTNAGAETVVANGKLTLKGAAVL